jgi:hypothetical protein
MAGRSVENWKNIQIVGGSVDLQLPQKAIGCMILRVIAGKEIVQKRINVVR